jgi:hypothetical protein
MDLERPLPELSLIVGTVLYCSIFRWFRRYQCHYPVYRYDSHGMFFPVNAVSSSLVCSGISCDTSQPIYYYVIRERTYCAYGTLVSRQQLLVRTKWKVTKERLTAPLDAAML